MAKKPTIKQLGEFIARVHRVGQMQKRLHQKRAFDQMTNGGQNSFAQAVKRRQMGMQ